MEINPSIELEKPVITEIEVTEEEKENFFKSVLTDTPYISKVSLMKDTLKLEFKSLTVEENSDIVNQISMDRDAGIAENSDAYFITISAYRLAVCLDKINGEPFSTITKDNYTATEFASYVKARADIVNAWPTFKLAAIVGVFQKIEAKILKLTRLVQDENF